MPTSQIDDATFAQSNDSNDSAVQHTNDDSVVSKRSAVYHGYFSDPYLRFFVKKLSRRSPLINRGYYLRMLVITDVVCRCIRHLQTRSKGGSAPIQVISLGAGYDTLAMRLKEQTEYDTVHFYEIDFPSVMQAKANLIQAAPPGSFASDIVVDPSHELIKIHGKNYFALGVDLRKAETELLLSLKRASSDFSTDHPTVIYAECVMQYMPPASSASLIHHLAKSFDKGLFVAYDQLNPTDSFGLLMRNSLRGKGSPLLGLADVPDAQSMVCRAQREGMHDVRFANFHDLSRHYLSGDERTRVEALEPFDEAEEWCEMCEHYGITMALTTQDLACPLHESFLDAKTITSSFIPSEVTENDVRVEAWPSGRFSFEGWGNGDVFLEKLSDGDSILLIFGGFLATRIHKRVNTVYVHSLRDGECQVTVAGAAPPALVFHSITRLCRGTYIVLGGRTNPTDVTMETYMLHVVLPEQPESQRHVTVVWSTLMQKGIESPVARYRHVAVAFPPCEQQEHENPKSRIFLYGGRKSDGKLLDDAWIASMESDGVLSWTRLPLRGDTPPPLCAAAAALSGAGRTVLLSGGLMEGAECAGTVWRIDCDNGNCVRASSGISPRFSHTMTRLTVDGADCILVLGGVTPYPKIEFDVAVLLDSATGEFVRKLHIPLHSPSWVRHSCVALGNGTVAVVGGGFTCFSFGTFATKPLLLKIGNEVTALNHPAGAKPSNNACLPLSQQPLTDTNSIFSLKLLTRPILNPEIFDRSSFLSAVRNASRPVLFRGVDLGSCVTQWSNPEYLKKVEGSTVVSVHVAHETHLLDFLKKNFVFRHVKFSELVDHLVDASKGVGGEESWYLRSIANNMKSERTNIWKDFAEMGKDFHLPQEAWEYIEPRMHQACLRFNAPHLQLWTHYDTLDNVLCQVAGRKRVVLFPPSEYNNLYMSGSSSAVINIDAPDFSRFPRFSVACRHAIEVHLEPGDMLYIPSLWLHHVTTSGEDYSISVNVFFERFPHEDYDKKDLYGNKDLPAAAKLRQAIVEQTKNLLDEKSLERTSDGKPLSSDFVEFALRQAIQDLEMVADGMAAVARAASNE